MFKKILLPLFLISITLPCKGFWGYKADLEDKKQEKGMGFGKVESNQSRERMMKRHRDMEQRVKEVTEHSKKMQKKMMQKSRRGMERGRRKRERAHKQLEKKSRKRRPRRKNPERDLERDRKEKERKEFDEYRDIDRPYL